MMRGASSVESLNSHWRRRSRSPTGPRTMRTPLLTRPPRPDAVRVSPADAGVCDLCGPAPSRLLLWGTDRRHGVPGRWAVLRCERCGLGRTSPRPDDLGAGYPDDHYMNHQERVDLVSRIFAGVLRRTAKGGIPRPLAHVALALVPAARLPAVLHEGARVLDIGCGTGHGVAALRAAGIDAHGLEPDEGAVRLARQAGRTTVTQGTLDENELEAGSWDLLRFWHTLEHTPSPSATLGRALRGLRPGGNVIVGVPNIDSLARIAFGPDWDGLELPRHLYHFNRASLGRMLTEVGFTGVSVRSVAVMGVLTGSFDARTRRGDRQRIGAAWSAGRIALHPAEILLAGMGQGDGLFAVARAGGQRRVPTTSTTE